MISLTLSDMDDFKRNKSFCDVTYQWSCKMLVCKLSFSKEEYQQFRNNQDPEQNMLVINMHNVATISQISLHVASSCQSNSH